MALRDFTDQQIQSFLNKIADHEKRIVYHSRNLKDLFEGAEKQQFILFLKSLQGWAKFKAETIRKESGEHMFPSDLIQVYLNDFLPGYRYLPFGHKFSNITPDNFRDHIKEFANEKDEIKGVGHHYVGRKLSKFIHQYGDGHVASWFTSPTFPVVSRQDAIEEMLLEWGGVTIGTRRTPMTEKDYEEWLFMLAYQNDGMIARDSLTPQEITLIQGHSGRSKTATITEHLQGKGGYFFDYGVKRVEDIRFFLQLGLLFNADEGLVVDTRTLDHRFAEKMRAYRLNDKDRKPLDELIQEMGFSVPNKNINENLALHQKRKHTKNQKWQSYAEVARMKYMGREEFQYMNWISELYQKAQNNEPWEEGWLEKGKGVFSRIRAEQKAMMEKKAKSGREKRETTGSSLEDESEKELEIDNIANSSQNSLSVDVFDVLRKQYLARFLGSIKFGDKKSKLNVARPVQEKPQNSFEQSDQAYRLSQLLKKESTKPKSSTADYFFEQMAAGRVKKEAEYHEKQEARKKALADNNGMLPHAETASTPTPKKRRGRSATEATYFDDKNAKTLEKYLGEERLELYVEFYTRWLKNWMHAGQSFDSFLTIRNISRKDLEKKFGIDLEEELAKHVKQDEIIK